MRKILFSMWVTIIVVILLLPVCNAKPYTYTKQGLEKLNQHKTSYGNTGCAPTSAGICLAWFAKNNPLYSSLVPDPGGDGIDEKDKYKAVETIGNQKHMRTNKKTGTTKTDILIGIILYIFNCGCWGLFTIKVIENPTFNDYKSELEAGEDVLILIRDGKYGHVEVGRALDANANPDGSHDVSFVDPWDASYTDNKWKAGNTIDEDLDNKKTTTPRVVEMISISPLNISEIIPTEVLEGYVVVKDGVTYVITGTNFYDVYVVDGTVHGVVDGTVYNTTGQVYGFANRSVYIVDGTYSPVYGNASIINGTEIYGPLPIPVGGVWVPVDKLALLTPYIALASTILVATAATAIYVKRAKPRKKKQ